LDDLRDLPGKALNGFHNPLVVFNVLGIALQGDTGVQLLQEQPVSFIRMTVGPLETHYTLLKL